MTLELNKKVRRKFFLYSITTNLHFWVKFFKWKYIIRFNWKRLLSYRKFSFLNGCVFRIHEAICSFLLWFTHNILVMFFLLFLGIGRKLKSFMLLFSEVSDWHDDWCNSTQAWWLWRSRMRTRWQERDSSVWCGG